MTSATVRSQSFEAVGIGASAGGVQALLTGTLYFACPGYHLSAEVDRTFSLSSEEALHF